MWRNNRSDPEFAGLALQQCDVLILGRGTNIYTHDVLYPFFYPLYYYRVSYPIPVSITSRRRLTSHWFMVIWCNEVGVLREGVAGSILDMSRFSSTELCDIDNWYLLKNIYIPRSGTWNQLRVFWLQNPSCLRNVRQPSSPPPSERSIPWCSDS